MNLQSVELITEDGARLTFNAQIISPTSDERVTELLAALIEAREDLAHWAAYAPEYFQAKWHLDADLARIDAVIARFGVAGSTNQEPDNG